MDNTINNVHSVLLEMLQWFHHQCEKNGLRYYMENSLIFAPFRPL